MGDVWCIGFMVNFKEMVKQFFPLDEGGPVVHVGLHE
jgi:hypothetical protein